MAFAGSLVVLFSPKTPDGVGSHGRDKLIHACLFGLLAFLAQRAYGFGLLLVLAYAVVSEVLQAVLPIGRDGNVLDALADMTGALLAWRWAWLHERHPVE